MLCDPHDKKLAAVFLLWLLLLLFFFNHRRASERRSDAALRFARFEVELRLVLRARARAPGRNVTARSRARGARRTHTWNRSCKCEIESRNCSNTSRSTVTGSVSAVVWPADVTSAPRPPPAASPRNVRERMHADLNSQMNFVLQRMRRFVAGK